MKQIIVTGDDFGLSLEVNRGIEKAHRAGILDTASLMVGAAHAHDAISLAKRLPNLKVGLHLVVVRGTPVLPPRVLPSITNPRGGLLSNLFEAGVRFYFQPRAAKQLKAEIRAQFEAFSRCGLNLDHLNAHHHMHIHPTVLDHILQIGREHGLRAIRLPREPFRIFEPPVILRMVEVTCLRPWLALMNRRLKRSQIHTNDYLVGRIDYARMSQGRVTELLSDLPDGITEMCFHPEMEEKHPQGSERINSDLDTLTSMEIFDAMQRLGVKQTSFAALG